MASYSTKLKTWGDVGEIYPDGYDHASGVPPVDEWHDFYKYNSIEDTKHLISLTNSRIETDKGTSHPSSPESSHLSYREDEQKLYHRDSSASKWRPLFRSDGDKMGGVLNMANYTVENPRMLSYQSNAGQKTLAEMDTSSGASGDAFSLDVKVGGTELIRTRANADGSGGVQDSEVYVRGAPIGTGWFSKQEGGTISDGAVVPIGSLTVKPGETIEITQAMLTRDGFTTAADNGINLIVDGENRTYTNLITGDGSTLYSDERGSPNLYEAENTGSSDEVFMIGIDNGHYGSGRGTGTPAYGGYIARIR